MKRILVIQLYRIGDVLQSFAVFRALRRDHPGACLDLLADPVVAEAGGLCPDVDRVLLFPRPSIRRALLSEGDGPQALYLASAALERLKAERYDLVVNLHQDLLGQRIAGAIGAARTLGQVLPPDGPRRLLGSGINGLLRGVADRRSHRTNLVDHLLAIAGTRSAGRGRLHLPKGARLRAEELIEARLPGTGPLVAVQSGASRPFRGLDPAWIGAVQARLPGARWAWLGSPAERPAIEARLASGLQGICVAGDTGLADLAALLARCDLVLSGDTAALHFAALLGVPSVSAFFGTAQPFETGPYGSGHLCVYEPPDCAPCQHMDGCSEPVCRRGLPAGLLADSCASVLGGGAPPPGVWRSRLDPGGLRWERTPAPGLASLAR